MKYRSFPNTDITASVLGMGCMRLPTLDGKVNRPEAIKMIRWAIDNGVTYVDTAYPYHGGESELVVGEALKDGYREKVTLATKLPMWKIEKYEDMEATLDEQLKKLQVDHVDFYLLHALDIGRYRKAREMGVHEFLDLMVKKGKIRYPAFSFHDDAKAFAEIATDYDWKLIQVQMNLLDEFNQATYAGIQEYCASFYAIGTPNSYESFRTLSEKMLKYEPKNPLFLSNVGTYHYIARKDNKTARKYYDRVLKIDPSNYTAIKNSVLMARRDKNVKLEKKYLPMLAKYGADETEKASAQARLTALNTKK